MVTQRRPRTQHADRISTSAATDSTTCPVGGPIFQFARRHKDARNADIRRCRERVHAVQFLLAEQFQSPQNGSSARCPCEARDRLIQFTSIARNAGKNLIAFRPTDSTPYCNVGGPATVTRRTIGKSKKT